MLKLHSNISENRSNPVKSKSPNDKNFAVHPIKLVHPSETMIDKQKSRDSPLNSVATKHHKRTHINLRNLAKESKFN